MWHIACPLLLVLAGQTNNPVQLKLEPVGGVTYADIAAGYRLNRSSFKQPRVTWCYVVSRPQAWYDLQKAGIRRYERLLAEEKDSEMKDRLSATLNGLRGGLATPAEEWHWRDHWANGERIQVRMPWPDPLPPEEGRAWRFSDDDLTPAALLTAYKNCRILSFVPGRSHSLRVWMGREIAFGHDAYLANPESLESIFRDFLFPPLLLDRTATRERSAHPTDRFFLLPENEMQVLGATQLGDARVYVVEHRDKPGEPWHGAGKEGVMYSTVTRAFIDPARGYLPLRVEVGDLRIHHGRTVNKEPLLVSVLECVEIQHLTGAGFYPTKGSDRALEIDPAESYYDRPLTADRYLAGPRGKMVVKGEIRWEVPRIVPDQPMSEQLFALEFPEGTRYSDMVTAEEHLVGTPDEAFQKMLEGGGKKEPAAQPMADRPLGTSWLFWVNLAALIVVLAILLRRRLDRA